MHGRAKFIDGSTFAEICTANPAIVDHIKGAAVQHTTLGDGRIIDIIQRPNTTSVFSVQFGLEKNSHFNLLAFRSGKIMRIEIPHAAMEFVESWQRESERKQEIEKAYENAAEKTQKLIKKFHVPFAKNRDASKITLILMKIDASEKLQDSDLSYLKKEKLYNVLATYHLRRFKIENDPWHILSTCSCLRKAKLPQKSIEIARKHYDHFARDSRLLSAVLTCRGGAFRDLGYLDQAEESAYAAIDAFSSSPHPYNLLGAVLYQKKNYEEGDKFFEKAVQFGSRMTVRDNEIRSALNTTDADSRKALAEYLFHKDPEMYGWLKQYL